MNDQPPQPRHSASLATLEWRGGIAGHLQLIDQTRLPGELVHVDCRSVEQVWEAIKVLRVRGAPAIGIAAAYAVVLGMQRCGDTDMHTYLGRLKEVVEYLGTSRPTAVNLFWALGRMEKVATRCWDASRVEDDALHERCDDRTVKVTAACVTQRLLAEAKEIHEEDRRDCRAIGRYGAELLTEGQGVLTHCNAGGLATSDYGTALAVFFAAHEQGKHVHVYVDETRPLLQGARLTAWELMQHGIEATLICDSMAAQVMKEGRVQAVVTGADRIAANGDTANKIGTYSAAVLAKAHGIPFYVAAPASTFDLSAATGDQIPIEQRDAAEITHGFGRATAPEGVHVYNPAFDVTPASLIAAIVTERGVIRPVTTEAIGRVID